MCGLTRLIVDNPVEVAAIREQLEQLYAAAMAGMAGAAGNNWTVCYDCLAMWSSEHGFESLDDILNYGVTECGMAVM